MKKIGESLHDCIAVQKTMLQRKKTTPAAPSTRTRARRRMIDARAAREESARTVRLGIL
jgi:hypothetical protein